jgi:signal transduction histidine kinase
MDGVGVVVALATIVVSGAALLAMHMVLRKERGRASAQVDLRRRQEAVTSDLQEQATVREAALSALPDGVLVIDGEGRVSYANEAARDLAGRRFDDVDEIIPAELRDVTLRAIKERESGELDIETGGRVLTAVALPSDEGAVVMLRDVTSRKLGEQIRRDFVVNASHELKTPVSSIVALSEALKESAGRDPAATGRFLSLLDQEAERLSRLVTDLLDLSRLEGQPLTLSPLRFDHIVETEVERLRPRAETAGLVLVNEELDQAEVRGAEAELGLLVHNLVDNAIRYTPPGGRVTVSVRGDDGSLVLRVSDTGIGISSRDLGRIFERFYRADPARSRETGSTGLGLAIVKHVAEIHGGQVEARSVLGAGSTFTVRLPV